MARDEKAARLKTALERFKLAVSADAKQRARELEAASFFAGEQWPSDIKTERAGIGQQGTRGAVAARPCLTINKLTQPVQQVVNQERNADLMVKVAPRGGDASLKDAEIRQGLIRNIQVDSRAELARGWAYQQAVTVGRGYYRVNKRYIDDTSFDQELVIDRILNQSSVYLDPFAQQPDWSDGEWAFITEDIPEARYRRLYKKSKLAKADDATLTALGDNQPGWVTSGEEGRVFRIAEYWYASYEPVTLRLWEGPDGHELASTDAPSDMPEGFTQVYDDDNEPIQRVVQKRRVDWCTINAMEILDETSWESQYIGIIPVIGQEFNLGGERRWMGLVEQAMDGQRLFNFTASAIAEGIMLAPKAPFTLDPEQIEGFEPFWDQANVRNFPYLPYRSVIRGSQLVPPPQRNSAEPPIQAMTLMLRESDEYIKATTGVFDPSLGNVDPRAKSGRAILALQKQAEHGTSNYLDNLASMSMTLEGKILNEMLGAVYDRPGRVVQILGIDDKPDTVMLNTPYLKAGPTMQPVSAPQGQPLPPGAEFYDLSKSDYNVVVEVARSFNTKREEGAAAMSELIQANPALTQIIGDLWIKDMDFPGAQGIADRLKKMLPPPLQEQEGQPPLPPAVQQQMAQMAQQLQQMQQALQQAQQIIQTEQVKAQAELQKENIKAEESLAEAHLNNLTKMHVADLQARSGLAQAEIKAGMEDQALRIQILEAAIAADKEARLEMQQHAHEVGMAHVEHAHAKDLQASAPVSSNGSSE